MIYKTQLRKLNMQQREHH